VRLACAYNGRKLKCVHAAHINMARAKKLPPGVRIQDLFRAAADKCKAEVKGLPRGEKGKAWRRCIGEYVKSELAKYEHTV